MRFQDLFHAFSRRPESKLPGLKPLTPSFRNRVLMRCGDSFRDAGYLDEFWEQVHSKLTYLHGAPRLSEQGYQHRAEDVVSFLTSCSDQHFLDFVELIFRVDAFFRLRDRDTLVEEINSFLRFDNLPYALTDFVWTQSTVSRFGEEYQSTTIGSYPQVVRKDSDFIHSTAVSPALLLLAQDRFASANAEFLEALEDYRRGDFGDSLTKCGSALESILKVICHTRGWAYRQQDTAASLIRTVVQGSGLDPFYEQPLVLIATIRNRLSKSHGAGTQRREITSAAAEYSINATAAAALLLIRASL